MRERWNALFVVIAISTVLYMLLTRLGMTKTPASAVASATTSSTPAATRILCFGDSLTAGTFPPNDTLYPYAPHLESTLKERGHNILVRHRGLPGWTAAEMVRDQNGERTGLRTAVKAAVPLKVVILLAGTNDLAFERDAATIANNIQSLHEICHEENVEHTLAIGIPPSGYQSMNQEAATLRQDVNTLLKEYCQREPTRATFVPFPFDFAHGDEKWAGDGLHFSAEGYRVLGVSLAKVVEQLLVDE